MNKLKKLKESITIDKATYVKPTMQVYEMEVEGAIMDGASGGDREYIEWSKADVNGFESPINLSNNA